MKVLALHPEKCTGCLRCELACSYMQTGTYQPSKSVIRVSPFEGYTSLRAVHVHAVRRGLVHDGLPGRAPSRSTRRAPRTWSTTSASAASSARSPARTGRCSTTPTRTKAYKCNLCGGAPACAETPARPRPSPSRTCETADWIGDFAAERTLRRGCLRRARGSRVMPTRHLIVGGGTAGLNCIRTIREEERGGASEITLVSAERPVLPHGAAVLPRAHHRRVPRLHGDARVARRLEGQAHARPPGRVRSTCRAATLTLDDGADGRVRRLPDRHRLARRAAADPRGRRARRPLLLDARRGARPSSPASRPGSRVVMVGAGFIAFTILNAILARGASLTIVEVAPRILPRMVDEACAEIVAALARRARRRRSGPAPPLTQDRGVGGQAEALVQEGRPHHRRRRDHGDGHPDQPRVARRLGHRASAASRAAASSWTITCARACRTVYAAGDVARGPNLLTGTLEVHAIEPTAQEHGRVVGANMAGRDVAVSRQPHHEHRRGVPPRRGVLRPVGRSRRPRSTPRCAPDRSQYRKLLFHGGRLTGAMICGPADDIWTHQRRRACSRASSTPASDLSRWKAHLGRNPFDVKPAFLATAHDRRAPAADHPRAGRPNHPSFPIR